MQPTASRDGCVTCASLGVALVRSVRPSVSARVLSVPLRVSLVVWPGLSSAADTIKWVAMTADESGGVVVSALPDRRVRCARKESNRLPTEAAASAVLQAHDLEEGPAARPAPVGSSQISHIATASRAHWDFSGEMSRPPDVSLSAYLCGSRLH
jgi:hypothetical protein